MAHSRSLVQELEGHCGVGRGSRLGLPKTPPAPSLQVVVNQRAVGTNPIRQKELFLASKRNHLASIRRGINQRFQLLEKPSSGSGFNLSGVKVQFAGFGDDRVAAGISRGQRVSA